MKPRLILCPGTVRSQFDGDYHYVNSSQLANLYGVPFELCSTDVHPHLVSKHDICLYPRYDGKYELPPEAVALLAKLQKKAKS